MKIKQAHLLQIFRLNEMVNKKDKAKNGKIGWTMTVDDITMGFSFKLYVHSSTVHS